MDDTTFIKPILTCLVICIEKELVYKNRYYYKLDSDNISFKRTRENYNLVINLSTEEAVKNGFKKVNYRHLDILNGIIKKFNDIQEVIVNGKPFVEWLDFEGISLWQFITGVIYASYPREVIELIEYLTGLIHEFNPKEIRILGNIQEHQNKTISLIGQQYNIPVSFYQTPGRYFKNVHLRILNGVSWKLKTTLTGISSNFKNNNKQIETGDRFAIRDYVLSQRNGSEVKENVLLVTFPRVWEKGKNSEDIDQYYEAFKPFFKEHGWEGIRLEIPYYFQIRGNKKEYIDSIIKAKRGGFKTILFDEYYADQIKIEAEKYREKFNDVFKMLENNEGFLKGFSWKNISFFTPLYNYWKNLFIDFLVTECISSILISRSIIDKLKPNAVFVLYEVGQYSRAMIIEAHRAGIQSVGLQHALIVKEHEYYLHKNQSSKPNFKEGFYGFIAPQNTLVYGKYFKDILTNEGAYPMGSVFEVGNWRYLNIDIDNIHQTARILKKTWFNSSKKIALILTSALAKEMVYKLIEKLKPSEYIILIKLHPDDHDDAFYDNIFNNNKFEIKIIRDHLYESILIADIIFAPLYTTVVLDCLALNKLVYCYRGDNQLYTIPWEDVSFDIERTESYLFEKPEDYSRKVELLLNKLGMNIKLSENEFTKKVNGILGSLNDK